MNRFTNIEIWKPVKGYDLLYEVSNFGNVKSLRKEWISGKGYNILRTKKETILAKFKSQRYIQHRFCKDGTEKRLFAHRIMWAAFIGEIPEDKVIDHIDNNPLNNNLNNLQLLSTRGNVSKGKLRKCKSSKYTGVLWHKLMKKWRAVIVIDRKKKILGFFENELDAKNAYENYLKKIL